MKRAILLVSMALIIGGSLAFAGGGQAGGGTENIIPGDNQPFGKYSPEITVTTVKNLRETHFEEGDTLENNRVAKKIRDDLGIIPKYLWVSESSQYTTKLNTSIAAGDIPDIFEVNAQQLDMLVRSDAIRDITDLFATYASDQTKQYYNEDPAQVDIAKFNGRLMAVPDLESTSDTYCLFVRQDWLDKLGLPAPKSMQDVLTIAEAFATRDPDGNGQNDTIGLLLSSSMGEIFEFMYGYHAYPSGWKKDSSGSLVYGAIQPEVKTALTVLADLYKKGYIDQEFAATDGSLANEKILSGKAGLFFGGFATPLGIREFENMNPTGKLRAYPLPSADSKPVQVVVNNPVPYFNVVNKKYAHPEALIKLANETYRNYFGPAADMSLSISPSGYSYWLHNIVISGIPNKNLNAHLILKSALASKDTSKLDAEQKLYYDWLTRYINNDRTDTLAFGYYWVFGPEEGTTFSVMDKYVKNNQILLNAFYGAPTQTMVSRQSTLDAMRDEVFTRIIMGSSPISAFDTFVSDWKRQGGDTITQEVNEWLKGRN
jgi:putative aldouronate transport system substrate-binding protein